MSILKKKKYLDVGRLFKLLLFGEQVWGSSFPTAKLWRDQILERKAKYVCVSTYVDFSSVQQQCLQHPKRINFRQVTVNSCQEGKIPSHAKIENLGIPGGPKKDYLGTFLTIEPKSKLDMVE